MARSSLRTALREIRAHPWRSILAAQGMVWAVAMVVVPAAVIQGSTNLALERAEELGTDRLEVSPDADATDREYPQESDIVELTAALPEAARLTGMRARPLKASFTREWVWCVGADEALPDVRGRPLIAGRFPVDDPAADGSADRPIETAVEAYLSTKLVPSKDSDVDAAAAALVGRTIRLTTLGRSRHPSLILDPAGASTSNKSTSDTLHLTVTGVIQDEQSVPVDRFGHKEGHFMSSGVQSLLDQVGLYGGRPPWLESGLALFVPRRHVEGSKVQWIYVRTDPAQVDQTAAEVERILTGNGRRVVVNTNALWSMLLQPELDGYLEIHTVLSTIYLVIGLLVMTNLLLLAGRQRRHEIALRRVEGATRGVIFRQFLWEGILLSIIGSVLGVPAGVGLGMIRAAIDPNVAIAATVPWGVALEASVIVAIGALFASAYPAWRASLHHPMVLLRRRGAA